MQQFNTIPNQGTFGRVIEKMNANFSLAQTAIGELEHATTRNKGLHQSSYALRTKYPNPKQGDWALVQPVDSGSEDSETIAYTGSYRDVQLGFTIPEGATIYLSGDLSTVTGRTTTDDSSPLTIQNETVATKNINYIRGQQDACTIIIGYSTGEPSDNLFPCPVYVCQTDGVWLNSGYEYSGDSVDLNDYLTKASFNTEKATLNESIDAVMAEIDGGVESETVTIAQAYVAQQLTKPIQAGNVIKLSGTITELTGRTANDDSEDPLTITSGTVATKTINYIKSATTGSVTISNSTGQGVRELLEELEDKHDAYETQTDAALADLNENVNGDVTTNTVTFTSGWQTKQLTKSIPQGAVIRLTGDLTQLTCRTTGEDGESPQTVFDGTVADRLIKYVRTNANTGTVTIRAISENGLVQDIENLTSQVQDLGNQIRDAKTGSYRVKRLLTSSGLVKPLKILAIGNSWSLNATQYLGEILDELGVEVKIGVCYAGGATLEQYYNNIRSNIAAYEFHKWENGSWGTPETSKTYDYILMADEWDIVTHQQQSGLSGVYASYQPYLHDIIEHDKRMMKTYPLFAMHATWAYPSSNESQAFIDNYNGDTATMYAAVLNAYNTAMAAEGVGFVFPCTPMIQQVRNLNISDIDTSDGTHLSTHGYYAASCLWAEMLLRNFFTYGDGYITDGEYKVGTLTTSQAASIRSLAATIVSSVATYFSNYNNY